MKRQVQPEILDELLPSDPRAIRSRHDLQRVNWWMSNHTIMADALKENSDGNISKQIIEIGAGDGDFLLRVAGKLPPFLTDVNATLIDRQLNLSATTLAEFAALQWKVKTVTADISEWSPDTGIEQTIVANLFLHHFEDVRLAELFQKISRSVKLFIAVEPQRLALPTLGGLLLALIGCNDVTRHDGTVSIRAGFAGQEISALWPDKKQWQLTERRAGLFSHLFIARRLE